MSTDCSQCDACAACDGSCGVCPYADQTKHYHEPKYGPAAFCGHEDCDRPDPHLIHESPSGCICPPGSPLHFGPCRATSEETTPTAVGSSYDAAVRVTTRRLDEARRNQRGGHR